MITTPHRRYWNRLLIVSLLTPAVGMIYTGLITAPPITLFALTMGLVVVVTSILSDASPDTYTPPDPDFEEEVADNPGIDLDISVFEDDFGD